MSSIIFSPKKPRLPQRPYSHAAAFVFVLLAIIVTARIFIAHRNQGSGDQSDGVTVAKAQSITPPKKEIRVGIQAGHWLNEEVPTELKNLYWNSGASANGVNEVDVNLDIAKKVSVLLQNKGVTVDILPVTIPEGYKADAFVAIHADGNDDTTVSGYKIAASQWDADGKAAQLSQNIIASYGANTGLREDSSEAVSENMTQYYAFNYIKYYSAIDPQTPGAIVEVGYITNSSDRRFLTTNADAAAQGVADGILKFLAL